ncbi:pyruvate dehydrogenase (acetyl-transferring) E1 component subunit alpha [archaeon]|nr:pyruvate dehydrogenase (acetyl-transferring) E1 component subunit alpha [archaeon]|tara:strand:+ start:1311 stop:2390 length:1080 start_codon:yes stop_codon:yes gene_type:complete
MKKTIQRFSVEYKRVLDEKGNIDQKLMPKISKEIIRFFYEKMVLSRRFDERAIKLQRQGRLGTYASVLGQEASQIGSALAMSRDDLAFPSYRESGVFIARGMPLHLLFSYWAGDERGMHTPKGVNVFPLSITVGVHPPHAVGAAMAFKYKKKKAATIVYFGDGATSKGDFHEAMNIAGTFKAPVVFLCQNNQYAISVPVKQQTAAETIAQKAIAYGFEGVQVDGNDVFGVYKATQDALNKARRGKGPTLIECFTYRRNDHTTSDDASKYRKPSEVTPWEEKDPLLRLQKYMKKNKIYSTDWDADVIKKADTLVNKAMVQAEAMPNKKPEEIIDHMFETLTPALKEQRTQLKEEAKRHGS